MFELVTAGGWLMLPLLACSLLASVIVVERWLSLRAPRVAPPGLSREALRWAVDGQLNADRAAALEDGSPLGRLLAAALTSGARAPAEIRQRVDDVATEVALDLERYLNTLGTIASVTPLLGLLGTVIGMIKVFSVITTAGVGDASVLAGGISEALITTATGLSVAIPALAMHRYFRGRVDRLLAGMEQEVYAVVNAIGRPVRLAKAPPQVAAGATATGTRTGTSDSADETDPGGLAPSGRGRATRAGAERLR